MTPNGGGHLVAEALALGAVEHGGWCRLHGDEMTVKGSVTGRYAHYLKTEDGRRALCVNADELIETERMKQ